MQTISKSYSLLIVFLTGISFVLSSCNSKSEFNNYNKNLVFLSNKDDSLRHHDVYLINIDTLKSKKITKSNRSILATSNPTISRNGKMIAFMQKDNSKMYLAIHDVTSGTTALKSVINNSAPTFEFTNDESKLVFSDYVNQKKQIFCLDLVSDKIVNLSDTNHNEYEPSISGDSKFVAFTRQQNDGSSIWVMDIDGANKKEIFFKNAKNRFPNFSPDSKKIAFTSSYKASRSEDSDVFTINIDGSNLEVVFDDSYYLTNPKFSPNGESIIFLSNRRGMKYQDIFFINFETDEKYNITKSMDFINKDCSFTQDSENIIFESMVFNNSDIYLYNLTTRNFKKIIDHPSWDSSPSI